MERLNIYQQIGAFDKGDYAAADLETQCNAGWFDWFCSDNALSNKTKKLYTCLKQIINSGKFNPNKTYVFFKNSCPLDGSLYDDFRICDVETGDVIFTIAPKSGYRKDNGKGMVWGKENDFKEPLFLGTWKEIKNWFHAK